MKNARRLPLIAGLLLALGTGVLLFQYLGNVRAASAAPIATRSVFVALHDIPARTLLSDAAVGTQVRPAEGLDKDVVTSRTDLAGRYSLITIPAGTVITRTKIGTGAAAALPARLPVGMRAVSISIDRVKGVAGLIQPGDRVDVIAVPPRIGNEVPKASAILRGALVLAMGNEVETTSATPSPDAQNLTTVTLALTPQQVDLLAAADLNTTLRLALRSPKENLRAFAPEPLTLGVAAAAAPARVVVPQTVTAPPAAAPAPVVATSSNGRRSAGGITVIDGDRVLEGSGARP